MSSPNRTEQVARAVADALGDDVYSVGWPKCRIRLRPDGRPHGSMEMAEYLADMNTAFRLWTYAKGKSNMLVQCGISEDHPQVKHLDKAIAEFPHLAFHKGPAAAIEALAVACGLVPPDPETDA